MKIHLLSVEEFCGKVGKRDVWMEHTGYATIPRKMDDGKIQMLAPHENLRFSYYTAKTCHQANETVYIDKDGQRHSEICKKLGLVIPFIPPELSWPERRSKMSEGRVVFFLVYRSGNRNTRAKSFMRERHARIRLGFSRPNARSATGIKGSAIMVCSACADVAIKALKGLRMYDARLQWIN